MRVLVDTSVWSAALRRSKGEDPAEAAELRNLILEHRVEIIGPIRQELLSGLRERAQFKKLERHLAAFPDIPLETRDYVAAARFFNICRSAGVQGSNTDFLICAVSIRRRLAVYTTDRDFSRFSRRLPIILYQARN